MKIKNTILKDCFIFGDFELRSGIESKYYFDKYKFLSQPKIVWDYAYRMKQLLPISRNTCIIAGVELGGVVLATSLSQLSGRPLALVRKKAKEYGTKKIIEGHPVKGKIVIIIEDVVTTGGAVIEAAHTIRKEEGNVTHVFCVLDREQGGKENLAKEGIILESLYCISDLLGEI